MTDLNTDLRALLATAVRLEADINRALAGKSVEITSNFNDQPHGRSKPSLKGKRFIVKFAHMETRKEGEIHLSCEGLWCFPQLWRDAEIVT